MKGSNNKVVILENVFLDRLKELAELKIDINSLVCKTFPDILSGSNVEIERVGGGTSNFLYKVKILNLQSENGSAKVVLVRINGEETSNMTSRDTEFLILSQLGGLKCRFGNGLMYDFKSGVALKHTELREEKHQIGLARAVAKLHLKNVKLPDDGISLLKNLENWYLQYKVMDKLTLKKEIMKIPKIEEYDEEVIDSVTNENNLIKDEVTFTTSIFTRHFMETVVFCHNDLTSGNCLYDKKNELHSFIDYEYAGHNFRGFDIGDHFSEYAGLELEDYTPPDDLMMRFISEYLLHFPKNLKNDRKRLFLECYAGMVASHLLWSFWGFLQAKNSIEMEEEEKEGEEKKEDREEEEEEKFDYVEYGMKRLRKYFEDKKRLVDLLKEIE